jgi:F420-dependent oxidoreductase-like protein
LLCDDAAMFRAGFQIPNFTYPGVAPEDLFEQVSAMAVTAEQSGFDCVMVMDHFFQLPLLGPPEAEMFESYTLLGALAARTETALLGTLVTGVTYRNPAILAKEVTALDVISKGRAFLGIGAAWFDVEHEALGVEFPPVSQRFEMLEEALTICRGMFRGENPTFEGKHFSVKNAFNVPAPIRAGGPPIMIGGQGEKKTLRLMAQHAEMANFTSGPSELPRKVEVLLGHCEDVGRDPSEITKTSLSSMALGATMEAAEGKRNAFLAERGLDWDSLDDATREMVGDRIIVGDADACAEKLNALLDMGLDGFTVNLPGDANDLEAIAAAGELLASVLASR